MKTFEEFQAERAAWERQQKSASLIFGAFALLVLLMAAWFACGAGQ